jgi:hypothetical protein
MRKVKHRRSTTPWKFMQIGARTSLLPTIGSNLSACVSSLLIPVAINTKAQPSLDRTRFGYGQPTTLQRASKVIG